VFDFKFQILGFVVIFQRGSSNNNVDDRFFFLERGKSDIQAAFLRIFLITLLTFVGQKTNQISKLSIRFLAIFATFEDRPL
jgi:hypothetical protein